MAPHAIEPISANASASASISGNESILSTSIINSNPFEITVDPSLLKGTAYTSPSTIISQTVYSISSKIFSYETPGADNLLDSYLQLWSQQYQRHNSFGVVPFFHKLQVRSGASNAILGYFGKNGTNGQPLSTLAGANALTYVLHWPGNLPICRYHSTSVPLTTTVLPIL